MKKIIIILIFLNIQILANNIGIVNTNVLLIKSEAYNESKTLGFYKINEEIKILDTIKDEYGKKWKKTPKGYVSSKYVFLKNDLANFLNNEDVNEDKYCLRLISYDIHAKSHKERLKRLLSNQNNIYLKYFKKTFVVYLVNFSSKDEALDKQNELIDIFPNSVIYSSITINKKIDNKYSNSKILTTNKIYKKNNNNYNINNYIETLLLNNFN